jgi:hypothetical protein
MFFDTIAAIKETPVAEVRGVACARGETFLEGPEIVLSGCEEKSNPWPTGTEQATLEDSRMGSDLQSARIVSAGYQRASCH